MTTVFWIIYLLGAIISFILFLFVNIKLYKEISVSCILCSLIFSIYSWITTTVILLLYLLHKLDHITVYKVKDKNGIQENYYFDE